MRGWILLLAEGFGSGRMRPGPGTWGSGVGLAWLALLLLPGSLPAFVLGLVASVAAAVWICGRAEVLLGRHDPGSVVLDEIVAVPACFLTSLAGMTFAPGGHFPGLSGFVAGQPWWVLPAGFALFRFFDIAKPWPIRAIQGLPGGWGIVADDLLAAAWVNVLALLVVA